jgi:hypothetical protein
MAFQQQCVVLDQMPLHVATIGSHVCQRGFVQTICTFTHINKKLQRNVGQCMLPAESSSHARPQ